MLTIPITVKENGENCTININKVKVTKTTTENEKKVGNIIRENIIKSFKKENS